MIQKYDVHAHVIYTETSHRLGKHSNYIFAFHMISPMLFIMERIRSFKSVIVHSLSQCPQVSR